MQKQGQSFPAVAGNFLGHGVSLMKAMAQGGLSWPCGKLRQKIVMACRRLSEILVTQKCY